MQLEKIQKAVSITTIISCLSFIVLTLIAMLIYVGGSEPTPDAENYLFFENFFSDLGRANVFDGAANIPSRVLFVLALAFIGVSLGTYFVIVIPLFSEVKKTKILSILGSISGVVAALGFILLGIVSLDRNPIAHGTFTFIAFIATVIALIMYTIVIFKSEQYPNIYAWMFIICTIISITYVVILFGGGSSGPLSDWTLQSVSQKLVVYIQIITFSIQAIGTLRYLNKIHQEPTKMQNKT